MLAYHQMTKKLEAMQITVFNSKGNADFTTESIEDPVLMHHVINNGNLRRYMVKLRTNDFKMPFDRFTYFVLLLLRIISLVCFRFRIDLCTCVAGRCRFAARPVNIFISGAASRGEDVHCTSRASIGLIQCLSANCYNGFILR